MFFLLLHFIPFAYSWASSDSELAQQLNSHYQYSHYQSTVEKRTGGIDKYKSLLI